MNLIRPIASAFLASLVFFTSIGVTINLHLCAGQVQSVALFSKAQTCKESKTACEGTEHHAKRNGCCEEESILLKGADTNAEVQTVIELIPSFNLIAVILPVLYSIAKIDSSTSVPQYALYKPPLIERDITVLVHSFLI